MFGKYRRGVLHACISSNSLIQKFKSHRLQVSLRRVIYFLLSKLLSFKLMVIVINLIPLLIENLKLSIKNFVVSQFTLICMKVGGYLEFHSTILSNKTKDY
jgi:hypothetical protein